jgi:hypothetical protein
MAVFGLPPLGVNASLAWFVVIALSMIAITIFVLGKVLPARGRPPLVTQVTLALMVLFSGSTLLLSLLFVFLNPDGTEAWTYVLLAFNFMMMGPAGTWFIGLVLFRDRRIDARGWLWPTAIAVVTTSAEVTMGVLFALANAPAASALDVVAVGLTSIWFFWSMAAIMLALLVWAPLAPVERGALLALSLSGALGPWVTAYPTLGGLAMGGLMMVAFVLLVRRLAIGAPVAAPEIGPLYGLAAAFLGTAIAGFYVVAAQGAAVADVTFGAVMAVVMTVELAYLFRRYYRGVAGVPWVSRAPDDDDDDAEGSSAATTSVPATSITGAPLPPPALER